MNKKPEKETNTNKFSLNQPKEPLENTLEFLPVGVVVHDADTKISYANKKAYEVLGLQANEIIGKTVVDPSWNFIHRNGQPIKLDDFPTVKVINSKQAISDLIVGVIKPRNDEITWLTVNGIPIFDSANNIKKAIINFIDITKRINTEEELKKQNREHVELNKELEITKEKYRQLIDFMPIGVSITDKDGNLTENNRKASELLGITKEEHNGREIDSEVWKIIRRDGSNMPPSEFASVRALKNNEFVENVEKGLEKKDGSITWLNVSATPKTFEEGLIISYIDISGKIDKENLLLKYTNKLKEANLTKDKFISIMTHDLRSPFTAIKGFSTIMEENLAKGNYRNLSIYSNAINRASNQVINLLENLTLWSRSQSNSIKFKPSTIEFEKIAEETIKLLDANLTLKNIKISTEIEENQTIWADKSMLSTILRNLIGNAIKFSVKGKEILLKSFNTDSHTIIQVIDNGIGIDKKEIENLFKIGTNNSRKGTEKESGTGLGLIITKEFVDMHNGSIEVNSQVNKGSIFTIKLPLGENSK
jgi:PAS domain S-box-containing protein